MARRSPGEGTITQRTDGRWCATLQLGGKRTWVYGKSRAEVADKLRKTTAQAQSSGKLPERHDLGSLMAAWEDTGANRWAPRTAQDYQHYAALILAEFGPGTQLAKLTPYRLQLFINRHSGRTAQLLHHVLHAALATAVRWDWLAHQPC